MSSARLVSFVQIAMEIVDRFYVQSRKGLGGRAIAIEPAIVS